jgi:hypothetical protein
VPTDELVDAGVVKLDGADAIAGFIAAAKKTRIWDRAPPQRPVISVSAPKHEDRVRRAGAGVHEPFG